jgi:DNA (cytosine-5)-methyltransferase 3A
MNVLSLFDGISCGQLALNQASISYNKYIASEIDKHSLEITKRNFPNTINIGDINNWKEHYSLCTDQIDLLLAGSPCQGFSRCGTRLNFTDERSKLFFKFVEIFNSSKPKYFLLENTIMKKEWQDIITKYLNVNPIKINSSLISSQNRDRLYWTNIPIDNNLFKNKFIMLKDIIGKYKGIYVYPRGSNKGGLKWYKGKCPTITYSSWQTNFFIVDNNDKKRKFTVEECEQIQTLPIGYTKGIANTNRYKVIGNAWTVAVIINLLKGIKLYSEKAYEGTKKK